MEFKVLLDGVERKGVITEDIEITYERNLKERGFFTKFSQDVEIVGDAYTYLIRLAELNPCTEVEIIVQGKCEGGMIWENLIEGVILLKDIKIDEYRCIITANIEPNGVTDIFLKFKDFEIDLNSSQDSLNGVVALTSPRRELHNFFELDGTLIGVTAGDYSKGFPIFDSLDYILKYITDGRLTLASDFLSTGVSEGELQIDFASTPILNEVVEIHFSDFLGNTLIAKVTSDGVTANFADYMRRAISFCQNLTNNDSPSVGVLRADATTGGGGSITFNVFSGENKIEIIDITTTGATVITSTIVTDYVRNANNLYITNGKYLTNVTAEPFIMTFDDLFGIIATAYDLTYAIENVAGNYFLRIEPIEYFFVNAVTLTLDEVPHVESEFLPDRIQSSVSVGRAASDGYSVSQAWPFQTLNCGGTIEFLFDSDLRYLGLEITDHLDGTGLVDYTDDLFLIKGKGLGGAFDEPEKYKFSQWFFLPPGFLDQYYYNLGLNNVNRLQDVVFFSPDKIDTSAVTKTSAYNVAGVLSQSSTPKVGYYIGDHLQFIKKKAFEYPIGFTDFEAMNARSIIRFNSNGGFYENGYILSLKYTAKTANAEIEVLIQ